MSPSMPSGLKIIYLRVFSECFIYKVAEQRGNTFYLDCISIHTGRGMVRIILEPV